MTKKHILDTNYRPRLCVFRSNKHIYAQIIDNTNNKTIISSSTIAINIKKNITSSNNCSAARIVGQDIAKKSKEIGIKEVVFDRQNRIYHGRIKALAEAAREEGIKF
uniref:Large ribosomal subunit protein uL18c n=2 Tax=Gracilariopsis TaxID=2781 RepID=A0A1C9CF98_9FLOR|nr:ribosomal protein L8 [Gracilariopsis lemaneiformis]YP_009294785.1 ribosomal protein L18 [Gracilariopsis chorda]AJO68426.1 ribosomal protein L18 [Gracilariopsis lemaneiformis]AML79882.1 ribosomal protein L8 [Gracilariopsis lemaneiformis]AOM67045.1 ribosomal protein L18 [Gracilariopsis chorda]